MKPRAWWALVLTLALAGCKVPSPEPSGQIRCGTNDAGGTLCPAGWECRWGRCCDSADGVDRCPEELERDTTGRAYAPDAQGRCPLDYENRFGFCCPTDTGAECPAGIVGAHCVTDMDCVTPSVGLRVACITNQFPPEKYPQGYCIAYGCDSNAANRMTECGPGAICLPTSGGTGLCERYCTVNTAQYVNENTCPGSGGLYSCYRLNFDDTTDPTGICAPDCARVPDPTSVCAAPSMCETTQVHGCLVYCSTDAECQSVRADWTCDTANGGICH